MNKAQYKYCVVFSFKTHREKLYHFTTGYIPTGLKMSEISKYIQGNASDKKIKQIQRLTQRYYYPEVNQDSSRVDVSDEELYAAQQMESESAES
jgi:hypothetical protein